MSGGDGLINSASLLVAGSSGEEEQKGKGSHKNIRRSHIKLADKLEGDSREHYVEQASGRERLENS